MKLNAKGMEIYKVWERKYYDELERLRKETGDPEYEDGWCIIDNPQTLEDEIGILIFGDNDNAIYHIMNCVDGGMFKSPDEEWMFGKSCREMVELLKPYFDIDDKDDLDWYEEDEELITFFLDYGNGLIAHGEWKDRKAAEFFSASAGAKVIGCEEE